MKRTEAALLYLIRTNSARTPAWLYKLKLNSSPVCPTCGVQGDIRHFFFINCQEPVRKQTVLFNNFARQAAPHTHLKGVLFRNGHGITRRDVLRPVVQFLKDANLCHSRLLVEDCCVELVRGNLPTCGLTTRSLTRRGLVRSRGNT